jgi:tyrosine-protein phosphatase YwqE
MSITGDFGPNTRKCAENLLKSRLVHIIATDAHSKNHRRPILSKAVKAAKDLVDGDYAGKLVNDYPAAIVEGKDLLVPEPVAAKRTFFSRLSFLQPQIKVDRDGYNRVSENRRCAASQIFSPVGGI